MSTFYGSLTGEKKSKTKQGQRNLQGHLRGWDHGIRVEYSLDDNDNALCKVWETGGSNSPDNRKLIKTYKLGKVSKARPGSEHYGSPIGGVR